VKFYEQIHQYFCGIAAIKFEMSKAKSWLSVGKESTWSKK